MARTPTEKPRVFIGSSTEARDVVHGLVRVLGSEFRCHPWTADTFQLTQTFLESLREELAQADFGVFVFHPDDQIEFRGQSLTATRDNTVLEYGMFLGGLGPTRTIALVPSTPDQRIPSDLGGVAMATYDPSEIGDLNRDVSPLNLAASEIRAHILSEFSAGESLESGEESPRTAGDAPIPGDQFVASDAGIQNGWGYMLSQGLLRVIENGADLEIGRTVIHGRHGAGTIVGLDPPGPDRAVTVEFPSGPGVYPLDARQLFWLPT